MWTKRGTCQSKSNENIFHMKNVTYVTMVHLSQSDICYKLNNIDLPWMIFNATMKYIVTFVTCIQMKQHKYKERDDQLTFTPTFSITVSI